MLDLPSNYLLNAKEQNPRTDKPYESPMPLQVPIRPWDWVSVQFSNNLPNVGGYDAILTIVCTLSKMAHFIP